MAFNDLLQASNRLSGKLLFETCLVGTGLKPVQCANQMVLTANTLLQDTPLDVLLVPGMWTESPSQLPELLAQHAKLIEQIRQLPDHTKVWSYCTGVCFLAESGRLHHLAGGGPLFAQWRAIVGPFFAAPPVVEHFTLVGKS